MLQDFDARSVQPQQPSGMGGHPCGMHDFQITNTYLKPSKEQTSLLLWIEFTSPVGRHMENFVVDGNSPQAIDIANKQISALCHATGVFRLTYPKNPDGSPIFDQAARELRGARGRMDIGYQKGQEPTPDKPAGGYVEVKKYYDTAGNEPGKQGAAPQPQQAQQPQQGQQQQPMTQQPNGGWGNNTQQPAQQQQAAPNAAGWGGNPQQQQQGGWQPGGNAAPAGQTPPWGTK